MFSALGAKIRGVAVTVPAGVDNLASYGDDWEKLNIAKFSKMTGVKSRHLSAKTQSAKIITASDLCHDAAERLINNLKIDRLSIDAIIFVSQYPDYGGSPATACVLQHRLQLKAAVMAFDVNQGCAGYVYGLAIAAGLLKLNGISRVLMVNGDANHKVNAKDRSQYYLFGDAGAATIIDKAPEDNKLDFLIETDGSGFKSLIIPGGGARHPHASEDLVDYGDGVFRTMNDAQMDGISVFNFTISKVPIIVKDFLLATEQKFDDFEAVIFHQANKYIINTISQKLKISDEKILTSLEKYGNTSSASIPLTICQHYSNKITDHDTKKILMCGFGVGLSLAITYIDINNVEILPIELLYEGFDDGID